MSIACQLFPTLILLIMLSQIGSFTIGLKPLSLKILRSTAVALKAVLAVSSRVELRNLVDSSAVVKYQGCLIVTNVAYFPPSLPLISGGGTCTSLAICSRRINLAFMDLPSLSMYAQTVPRQSTVYDTSSLFPQSLIPPEMS